MTLGSCFPVSSTLTTRCRRRFYDVDHSGTKISELFSVKMNSRKFWEEGMWQKKNIIFKFRSRVFQSLSCVGK